MNEEVIFISAKLPVSFSEKLEKYIEKKNNEESKKGGVKKITKKDAIHFALNTMIEQDTFTN